MKVVLLVLSVMLGGSAFAATPKEPPRKQMKLDGSDLTTQVIDPKLLVVEARKKVSRPTLIDVRKDFVPELMRSAE